MFVFGVLLFVLGSTGVLVCFLDLLDLWLPHGH